MQTKVVELAIPFIIFVTKKFITLVLRYLLKKWILNNDRLNKFLIFVKPQEEEQEQN